MAMKSIKSKKQESFAYGLALAQHQGGEEPKRLVRCQVTK